MATALSPVCGPEAPSRRQAGAQLFTRSYTKTFSSQLHSKGHSST